MRRSAVWVAIALGLVVVYLAFGLLTMTDPAPTHPVHEGSPAYTGAVDAPEVGPVTP